MSMCLLDVRFRVNANWWLNCVWEAELLGFHIKLIHVKSSILVNEDKIYSSELQVADRNKKNVFYIDVYWLKLNITRMNIQSVTENKLELDKLKSMWKIKFQFSKCWLKEHQQLRTK